MVSDRSSPDAVRRPRCGPADSIDASGETDEALQAGYADRIRSGRSPIARGLMRALGIHLALRLVPRFLLDDPEIVAVGSGPGWVRLRRAGHVDRRGCLERQGALLALPALFGLEPFILEDVSSVARGDVACEYVLRSRSAPRWAVVVAAGCAALAVAVVVKPPSRLDLVLGLVGAAVVWAAERWRSDRGDHASRVAAAHAFRRLVEGVRAGEPATPDHVAPITAASPPPDGDASPVLQQEGDVWRITYAGVTIRVRHSRGLALLSHLLRRPGEELHVQTLDTLVPSAGASGERPPMDPDVVSQNGLSLGLGDAGPVIDDRARAEYRRRLGDLRAELDDAERCNDPGRAAAARAEAEQVEEELRAATGLHGRPRRVSSDVDRMRIAVTRRIRSAIEHLGKLHPALGDHLERSVRTGFGCCYSPGESPERSR